MAVERAKRKAQTSRAWARPPAQPGGRPLLGRLLVEDGAIAQDQLDRILATQAAGNGASRKRLGQLAIELGYVTEEQLLPVLARQLGLSFVNLSDHRLDPAAADMIPEGVARRYRAVPVGFEDETLVVAIADPTDVVAIDDIRLRTHRDVKVALATTRDIDEGLRWLQRLDRSAEVLLAEGAHPLEEQAGEEVDKSLEGTGEEVPVVRAINRMITQAVQQRASDIHVEPQEGSVNIRYRIDGVLHDVMQVPKHYQPGLISRLKVMATLNIAERRIPQDGRTSVIVEGQPIDLRIGTLPSTWGENVAVRILDRGTSLLQLEEIGLSESALAQYRLSFTKPHGMILATGPTGSGKTTTLYATLNILNTREKKIITVEDPVEYRLTGATQVQVNPKAGLTFASALRSIVRGDPDIVMVGEIRDRETALTAVEAALTGHLVLSTLHTNDAPSALTRLIEVGVEPFLVASSVRVVLAQRLARRLCLRCREAYTPTREALVANAIPWDDRRKIPGLYRASGCQYCAGTGYWGRIALAEVIPVTEEIERLTVERPSSEEIRRVAVEGGMRLLREDGLDKAWKGLTSLEEVLRVA